MYCEGGVSAPTLLCFGVPLHLLYVLGTSSCVSILYLNSMYRTKHLDTAHTIAD